MRSCSTTASVLCVRWVLAVALVSAATAIPAEQDAVTPDNLFELSIEQLMEIPVVFSASRTEQKITRSAVPVSILTAEDIHRSGATNIPEVLRFVPGVDVRRLDRTRYSVGVRGMVGQYSDRTLVLINGRTALDPVYGTTDWLNLPVLMEDIERIEIVRGLGGAVWGANAYNGVINIITKKPSVNLKNIFSTTVTEFGDTYTHIRAAEQNERWSWRASAGYQDSKSSDAAGAGRTSSSFPDLNPFIGFDNYVARDFFRSWKFDTEAAYTISESDLFRFGIAHASSQFGDRESIGYYPMKNSSAETTRLFARLEHQFDEDTSAHVQWFGNFAVRRLPNITARYDYYENDLEAQFNFKPHDAHTMSVGGNLRWFRSTSKNDEPVGEMIFRDSAYDEYWAGIFAVDRWHITDRLTLESQARLDRYSGTHSDWAARSALLYALDDTQNHVVRAGASRGYRTAGLMIRETGSESFSMMPGFLPPMFTVIPPVDDLKNETTYALEAGYTGRFSDRLTVRIDAYYQRMDHILGANTTVVDVLGVPISTTTFENQRGANAYGAELELIYAFDHADVSAWYAYNELHTDDIIGDIRAFKPARHKAGIKTRYHIDDRWTAAAFFSYNDALHVNGATSPFADAETFSQLDLTLSRKLGNNAGEFMIGVSDLLNETQGPIGDINTFTMFETPGRTFFARLQLYF